MREYVSCLNKLYDEKYSLEYSRMDKEKFLEGTVKSINEDNKMLESEFKKALVLKNNKFE